MSNRDRGTVATFVVTLVVSWATERWWGHFDTWAAAATVAVIAVVCSAVMVFLFRARPDRDA